MFSAFLRVRPELCNLSVRERNARNRSPSASEFVADLVATAGLAGARDRDSARAASSAAADGAGDADRDGCARPRAGAGRTPPRTTHRDRGGDGQAHPASPDRGRRRRARRMGGLHRRVAHACAARLGARGRRYRCLDRAAARCPTSRVVRRRAAAERRVLARGARLRAADLARNQRASHRPRARIERGIRRSRHLQRDKAWRRGAPACEPTTTATPDRDRERRKHGCRHSRSCRGGKQSSSKRRGGELCNRSGASPVYVSRGSRSARCSAPIVGTWESRATRSYSCLWRTRPGNAPAPLNYWEVGNGKGEMGNPNGGKRERGVGVGMVPPRPRPHPPSRGWGFPLPSSPFPLPPRNGTGTNLHLPSPTAPHTVRSSAP